MLYEIWKPIPDLNGYLVSDRGRVKSLNYRRQGRQVILKQCENGGYMCVNIRGRLYTVRRLVASAFVPNPNGYSDVRNKNGNTLDDTAENLEWVYHNANKKGRRKENGNG